MNLYALMEQNYNFNSIFIFIKKNEIIYNTRHYLSEFSTHTGRWEQ